HIRKCVESILLLSMPDLEIILGDSNSTDETKQYLDALSHSAQASKLRLTILLSERRIKWTEANQTGLNHSKGEWVCLSNPDIIFNECFPKMLEFCFKSNVLVAAPQLISQDGTPTGYIRLVTRSVFFLNDTGEMYIVLMIVTICYTNSLV